ncbi:trypsin-like peptidase domain-containing protein [Kitasatospora paracochleata]|uniref:V8-like Glu-specific endopeptidase n=1 Tax=Kitasatospora paracochleata TaxID=58354 RepID=A0ABT1J150_9ACTN|nr:trypsin-like peptidase domain-containing protein [Kitasatospora paracochleata]MCP2310496.1 V8-like Glu-specific endopeptidase [Kitasatospora paracochleata]
MRRVGYAVLAVALAGSVAGCGSSGGTSGSTPGGASGASTTGNGTSGGASAHGWTKDRLKAAVARHGGTTRTAKATPLNSLVGAVFTSGADGDHFCTASVVDSPGRNLIVTAAHCLADPGAGARTRGDLVFVPGYRDGDTPNGVWQLGTVTVDPSWESSGNQDMDVAFATVQPLNGQQVQQVLGANKLGTDRGYQLPVKVTGYPSSGDAPITCANNTTEQSPTQLRIDCPDYTGGTSGSPWVTDLDPATHTGTVVGVIGGYQEGGDTPDTSYSSYFGDQVQALYQQATTGS